MNAAPAAIKYRDPSRPAQPLRRLVPLLLLLVLLLQACSATRLAYQNAPTLLYWRMDRYLDFDTAQAARLRESLA